MPIWATALMNFENRTKKDHMLYDSIYRKCPKQAKSIEAENRLVAVLAWGPGRNADDCSGLRVSFQDDENVLKSIMVMIAQLCA